MKLFWIVGSVCLVAGLAMFGGGGALWRSHAAFAARALRADGVVTDFTHGRSSKRSGTIYTPIVTFTTSQGRELQVAGSGSGYRRGDQVRVLYDPDNPEQAQIDSLMETWFWPLLLGFMGIMFGGVGGGMLVNQLRQSLSRTSLTRHGTRVQATFHGVDHDTSLTVNGRSPWRLNCQWRDPVTGKVYVFHSDEIWFDPTRYVQRDELDVMINSDDPNEYEVDTSFLPEHA
jgi:Protein of unknown function (DUF3592)